MKLSLISENFQKLNEFPGRQISVFEKSFIKNLMRIGVITFTILIATSVHLLCALPLRSQPIDQVQVKIGLKNETLAEAFRKIEAQSPFHFMYRNEEVKNIRNLNLSVTQKNVEDVLKIILYNTDLTFRQVNNQILIMPEKGLMGADDLRRATTISLKENKLTYTPVANIVHGKVSNANGEPLIGVSVIVKGATTGTSTDADGNYAIDVPKNGMLEFSFVGYTTKEVPIIGRSEIDVVMEVSVSSLDQVVVVGYGTAKQKTLTGSVASVSGADIIKSPVMNVSNSLSGRLPGVMAITRGAEPGNDGATIRIRGSNTLGDNSALIVVDGIPGRSMDRIDPNAIESITVLKDASAAIYGSQAANGVILITTKRGKRGKPQVSVNINNGFTQPTRIPKMTNAAQYATALNELDLYQGLTPRYTTADIQKYSDGSDPWGHPNTNWFDAVLKKWSSQQQGNVTVSGGGEFMRYFVSVGAKTEDAYYKHSATKYNQYDFRTNLDMNISKDVHFSMDVTGREENSNFPGRSGDGGSIFFGLLKGKPTMPAYWPNGLPGPDIERGENPVALATNKTGFTDNQYYVLNTNFKLDIKIPWIEGLTLTGNAAVDKGFRFNKNFQQPWYLYSWNGSSYGADSIPILVKGKKGISDPNLTQSTENNHDYLLNGLINYKKDIGLDHHINFLAGVESRTGGGNTFSAYRRYFVSTAIPELNAGGSNSLNNSGSANTNARLNYFGRVNYNFKEKYLVEFVWREDGSYIFPQSGRYGFFPGVSVGWRMSDENFWKGLSSFSDNVKLRASYGKTGNDRIAPWQYVSTYGFGGNNYIFDISNEARTLYEIRIPNPNVTWEVAKQADIGIDAGFLNNKLLVTFDYFDYRRSNILWARNASVPSSTGLTLPKENIGKVSNKGFDFDVSYSGKTGSFKYRIDVNGGYAKNQITFWDESPGAPSYQRSTGHPMPTDPANPNNDLYYQAIGVYADQASVDKTPHWPGARPGDVIFKDVNGDGVINANDRVRSDKNDIPRFTGGLGLSFQYKQWDLSTLFQGATGAVRYLRLEAAGNFGNYLLSDFQNRWTPDNPNGTMPRMFDRTDQYYRSERSTYLVHKTDFVRLKNLEFGYTLPNSILSRGGINSFRVFASGYNLFTYSLGYKDFDPEDNNQGSSNYPPQRIISLGLSVTF